MYLTAQHVRREDDREGINAFLYLHNRAWDVPPSDVPDEDTGTLVRESVTISPGGNVVCSYLDIVAPDRATWNEIHDAFFRFVAWAEPQPLPWVCLVGQCLFRFGLESRLSSRWRSELAALYAATRQIHDVMRRDDLSAGR